MDLPEKIKKVWKSFASRPRKLGTNVLFFYIVKELLLYFFISFAFFFMVFFVNQILLVAENLLKSKVPMGDVMRLLVCYFPSIIAQSAPYATFVGFMMCLGRMMTENEVLVLRASGFSYHFVFVPVVLLGIIISIISFCVNDYFLPLGSIKAQKLSKEIFSATPAVELESNSVKNINGAKIAIGKVTDHNVSDLIFFQTSNDGKDRLIVAGESEVIGTKTDGILMQMDMKDSTIISIDSKKYGDYDVLEAGDTIFTVFDTTIRQGRNSNLNPDQMTSYDLHREIKRVKEAGSADARMMNAYRMIFNRKFSIPFASIFFALLSISLAFLFGKHNGQTIGLILGLIICVLNWAMLILGQLFSTRNGFNGFWAMWLPDFILGGTGVLLYLVVLKR